MKITRQQLKRIVKEERNRFLNEVNWERLADEMDVDPQIRKVGDLRKIIKTLQSEKRAKLGIEGLKDLGIGALADIIPGAGTGLSLVQTLKSMYSAPDDKKTNTMLDKLNVDDEVAAIVDDTVEDNFLNVALDSLEGLSDEDDIPDINEKLASWLKSKYDARTVDGFQEGKKMKLTKQRLRRIIREEAKSTSKYDDDPALKGDQDELPDHLQKAIIDKKGKKEAHHSMEESDSPHEPQYGAPQGSKRDKQLDATKADLKSGDPERIARAYRRRERMEKKERSKKGFKNKPRKDSKKESIRMTESDLREAIRNFLAEELSKKTKETLKKKAEKRGLTPSSVYAEFRKGLAAWASSGSRKGMSQHQWAHARVNSATPSKPWAVVKKSKKKKKKGKKK